MALKAVAAISLFGAVLSDPTYCGCRRTDLYKSNFPKKETSALPHTYTNASHLPSAFDWRNVDGVNYISVDLNQHIPQYCGSCWLHAGIGVLNDRLKIAKKVQWPEVNLARQVVLNCGGEIAGSCKGGSDYGVYHFASLYGLPDTSCQLYSAQEFQCSPFRNCMNCDPKAGSAGDCYPVHSYGRYFVREFGRIEDSNVHKMKSEIFRRGPISCAIDASAIENGKYQPGNIVSLTKEDNQWKWDHDVIVAGWGYDKEKDMEYWHVRNSWGTFWGDQGWFKVEAGVNAIGIESECSWAVVDPNPVVRNWGPDDSNQIFPSTVVAADVESRLSNLYA